VHPNAIHTTVAAVRYDAYGRDRKGVCSTFLADRVQPGATVPIYLQPNNHFGVPDEEDRPMIMVGPGTGIAPFRAFLQERRATNAPGKNWLFFGEQQEEEDFLYEEELKGLKKGGTLDRLDTAFSRDQDEKVYVQHKMLEASDELFGWLEDGACFFVCGDRTHMAKDVDAALHQIVQEEGDMSEEGAEDYVKTLKKDGRYVRDVY
jgi:sulfite reductase (NADPH) flavoprotein alpha-component